jgi:hypothetical protein
MTRSEPGSRAKGTIALVVGAAVICVAVALGSTASATPPNDDFPGTAITSLPFTETVDTSGATDQPGEPFCGSLFVTGLTVWHNFTPSADTILMADTSGSDYYTYHAVYTGSSLADLTCVGFGGLDLQFQPHPAVIEAKAGQTYYFQAGSSSSPPETGSLTFNLREGSPPPNDDFPGIEITNIPFSHTVDATFATADADEDPMFSPIVWFNYTPPKDATLVADTLGSEYKTHLALRNSKTGGFSSHPADANCGLADIVVFQAKAGETVYFEVGSGINPAPVLGTLVLNLAELPSNGTADPSTLCPETAPSPGGDGSEVGPPEGLPSGGGPPGSGGEGPWEGVIAGIVLTFLAAGTLLLGIRRA